MLEIFNDLKPFFEDCYRNISIREYARLTKISPPTASKLLKKFYKEGLLTKEPKLGYIMFQANRDEKKFIELSRFYWYHRIEESGLLEELEKELFLPCIILFGSLSKAETTKNSDMDLAVIAPTKELELKNYEKKIGRKIHIIQAPNFNELKSSELRNNILNGYVILGKVKF